MSAANANAASGGTLREQQLALARAVRAASPAASPGLLAARPDGGPARLDVYRHAYAARLLAALRDNFELLALAMGDAAFDALGLAYLAAQPSRRPSIRWFGHRLAAFMDDCLAASNGRVSHPALADLARMDWALRQAFDAADATPIARQALAEVPAHRWPGLRLRLHPSVQCVALGWAVEPAWQALRDGVGRAEPALPAPAPLAHWLLVWRRGLKTQWRSLEAAEAALLQAAAAGQTFARICDLAAAQGGGQDAALQRVVGALQQWLTDELICGLRPG